eukprot:TRINITY_DN18322_c0_g1_i5.p1 TRINITY_DN18322_c0_g1~~TRINITY_DN18322_c0_g1_i5.p1  ORF type:complete len:301 (-),score=23.20 TRINITY_DN18322_c0_g1_i5:193-1095(-)
MQGSPSSSVFGVPLLTNTTADSSSTCVIQRHGQCCDAVGVAVADIVISCASTRCVDVLLIDLSAAANMGLIAYNVASRVGIKYQTIPTLTTSRPILGGIDCVTMGGTTTSYTTVASNVQVGLEGVYGGGGSRQLSTLIPRRIHRTSLGTSHISGVLPTVVSTALTDYHSRYLTATTSSHQPWVVVCAQLVDVLPMPRSVQETVFNILMSSGVLATHTTLVGLQQDLSPSGWAVLDVLSTLVGRQGWTLVVVLPSPDDDPLSNWMGAALRGHTCSSKEVHQVPLRRGDSWAWRVLTVTPQD